MLRDSEAALHRGRMLGGSCCEIFDTAILKSEQVELQLEGEFTQALERREFRLVYQPIVSLGRIRLLDLKRYCDGTTPSSA